MMLSSSGINNLTAIFMYFTFLCMTESISSTHLVRHLGDCLAKVKYGNAHLRITKNNEPIAELRPVPTSSHRATWGSVAEALASYSAEPDFADDLDTVNRADQLPENPWD
jgi:antitoxin (DNA-binding transcriptional repressor) of toxin-antitoxin stability system